MLTTLSLLLLSAAPADTAPATPRVAHPPMHVAPALDLAAGDSTDRLLDRALSLMVSERWQAARDVYRTVAARHAPSPFFPADRAPSLRARLASR